jgi:hypothetical protein
MNIKVLSEQTRLNPDQDGLFDLFEGFMMFRDDMALGEIEVLEHEEMRIDLLIQRMYNLEPNEVYDELENIDVLLFINHIDNPLNIKKAMILKYPERGYFINYRYTEDDNSKSANRNPILAVPNLSTRRDSDREKYKRNEYSLPPVAQPVPKPPIREENGIVKIGGI